jgi:hypothetical protein
MTKDEFRIEVFQAADVEGRTRLLEGLERHLHTVLRSKLESLFVEALGELPDQQLRRELPWTEGEFAFSDATEGREGLRVAFDVVISVGFADRREPTDIATVDFDDD